MLLSQLIEKLTHIQKEQGELDVCIADFSTGQYFLLTDAEIFVCDDMYVFDNEENIVAGYENGKKAVSIGNL